VALRASGEAPVSRGILGREFSHSLGQFQTRFETFGQSTLHLIQTGFGFDDNDDILDGQYPWISEEAAFILP
jgi:hypothetical protein